jgi:hypothetical protein
MACQSWVTITADVTSVHRDVTESLVMVVCIILARGFGCCQRLRVSGKIAQQMAETWRVSTV